jgi:hypothetical protein
MHGMYHPTYTNHVYILCPVGYACMYFAPRTGRAATRQPFLTMADRRLDTEGKSVVSGGANTYILIDNSLR